MFYCQQKICSVKIQSEFLNCLALIFNFNFYVLDVQCFFRKFDDVQQFFWMNPVVVVIGVPKLEIDDLFFSHRSSTVYKVFVYFPDFCNVKVVGNQFSVWQLKSNVFQFF